MTTIAKPQKPPKLPVADIIREEEYAVTKTLLPAKSPQKRLEVASRIVREAEVESSLHRPLRDAAGLSLSLYDGVRAVNDVIGVSRAYFHSMRLDALQLTGTERGTWLSTASKEDVATRAERVGFARLPDAALVAAEHAEKVARAEARATAARLVRDRAIVALSKKGWTRKQIAEVAGFDDSRVSQIIAAG